MHVASPLSGQVLSSPALAGQKVAAGDVLFEIDSHDVAEAKADLLKKAAALDLATKTAEREALFFEKKISAEMEVQEARARQTEARIELDGARSRLARLGLPADEHPDPGAAGDALSGRIAVRASRAGTVLEGHANPGEYVEAAKELFVLSDLSKVWVWADLKDADLSAVSAAGKPAAIVEGPAGIVARGNVDIVSGTVNEQTSDRPGPDRRRQPARSPPEAGRDFWESPFKTPKFYGQFEIIRRVMELTVERLLPPFQGV